MKKLPNFKLLDCTIRDGGYLNNWNFDKRPVREVYRSASKAGVDIVEMGYRSSAMDFDKKTYGLWRFSEEKVLREATEGIYGAKIALMADFGKAKESDFTEKDQSVIDIIRMACHKNDIANAVKLLEKIKRKGYQVSLNAMGYSNYTPREQKKLVSAVKNSNLDMVYVVDSYGSLFPGQIKPMLEPLLEIPGIKVGFHPHNGLQMAFANTLEAIQAGAHVVDSTFYGMGRGAGNLPTEIIVLYAELMGNKKYNVIPILNCIDAYFMPLHKKWGWGYQLPFMLSGMYKCHPNYAKNLVEFREYTIGDICKGMEFIEKANSIGYSQEVFKNLVDGGLVGRFKETKNAKSTKTMVRKEARAPYIDRHKGRDFLILANGPTLKKYKPAIDKLIKKIDPVIMGANNISGMYAPHYHAFNNKKRFMMYSDTVSKESKLFLSQHFPKDLISEYTDSEYEKIYYKDNFNADFDIKSGVVQANCRTISILLLGVAIAMGAKRIFAAGMDGYVDLKKNNFLFYNEQDEKEDQSLIVERHRSCEKFLDQIDKYLHKKGKEGLHILTPTSYRSYYKGIENYLG